MLGLSLAQLCYAGIVVTVLATLAYLATEPMRRRPVVPWQRNTRQPGEQYAASDYNGWYVVLTRLSSEYRPEEWEIEATRRLRGGGTAAPRLRYFDSMVKAEAWVVHNCVQTAGPLEYEEGNPW